MIENIKLLSISVGNVCPIFGVGIDGESYRVHFVDSATVDQRNAALAIVTGWKSKTQAELDAIEDSIEAAEKPELNALKKAVASSITDIDTFLVLASPTQAQTLAMVKKLCQQNKQIIKRIIQL